MDNIAQLLALIQLQQQRMQQEQQDQAQLMANLVNQWDQMNVARSVRTVMTNDFFSSGAKAECSKTWLQKITQTAITQGWNDKDTETSKGTANKWQDTFGPTLNSWISW